MPTYSPFDKAIKSLESADLDVLKTVTEGWYVEYKRVPVNAKALAKAVSAFANTYGGWLFLGVVERSKDEPVAGSFPGIPEKDVDAVLQRLRQAAAEHLSSAPHFDTKTLRGPCPEIGLVSGTSVIAVEIPASYTAPHIHKDGRIYRRVADSSDPKPETDRFILDQLWRRADPIRATTRKWVTRDPEFSKGEKQLPYLRLLLCVDPWLQQVPWISAPLPQIRKILMDPNSCIPFDTFTQVGRDLIARQVGSNDPHNYALTWRLKRDLSSEIVLPLPCYRRGNPRLLARDLDGYDHRDRFISLLEEKGYCKPQITDLNFLMNILAATLKQYRSLLMLAEAEGHFYFKVRALNVWRLLPFLDIETVMDEYKEHGLPILMDSTVTYPAGEQPESFKRVAVPFEELEEELESEASREEATIRVQAQLVCAFIANALGVPIVIQGETNADTKIVSFDDLIDAGFRARKAQENRFRGSTTY